MSEKGLSAGFPGSSQGRKGREKRRGSYLRSVNALEHKQNWDWEPTTKRFYEQVEYKQGCTYKPREVQEVVLVRAENCHDQKRHEK